VQHRFWSTSDERAVFTKHAPSRIMRELALADHAVRLRRRDGACSAMTRHPDSSSSSDATRSTVHLRGAGVGQVRVEHPRLHAHRA
jgi:hypothetical protein